MIVVVGLIFYVCCCNGENPRNPTVTARETRSTDPTARTYQQTVSGRIIRDFIFYGRITVLLKTRPARPEPTPRLVYGNLICKKALGFRGVSLYRYDSLEIPVKNLVLITIYN